MIRRPPRSTLFPYPPLFRPRRHVEERLHPGRDDERPSPCQLREIRRDVGRVGEASVHASQPAGRQPLDADGRSEEHTSELQSLAYLVCRLLLEKKKTHAV